MPQSYGMMTNLKALTNDELIASLKALVGDERAVVVAVLRHLSEFEDRRLATKTGFPSLFEYCVRELRYAQGEAFRRIRAARAAEKYGILYRLLERGTITLTTVALLEPHLKWDNYRRLIRTSKGLSTREVEALVASLSPVQKSPAERVRFLSVAPAPEARYTEELFAPVPPVPTPAAASTPQRPVEPSVESVAPAESPTAAPVKRVEFTFTGDEALFRDVERVKELSRHKWPEGRLEDVFEGAIKALLAKIDPDKRERRKDRVRRLAAGVRSRHIAKAVKDEVWARDGGRCAYDGESGNVCGSRASLEFDHVRPWALGGSNETANIRLLCRAHNDLEARRVFGDAVIGAGVDRRREALRKGVKI